ncbi:MAG: hypothetical protein ACPL1A_09685 [Candidatus Kapaibacteriota bacterium]
MIKEISNFVEKIPDNYFTEGLTPAEGLHIWIKLDEQGNVAEKESYRVKTTGKTKKYYDKNNNECDFPYKIIIREAYSGIISINKSLDAPAKKIHSSNPFVIWFKKQNENEIIGLLKRYFDNTKKYYEEEDYDLINKTQEFLENNLYKLLNEAFEQFKDLKATDYIKIYFDIDLEIVKKGYENYLGSNLYNKSDYNLDNDEYGLSGFLNGDNVKKIFIMHKTSHFNVNNHISKKEAYNLYLFEKLISNKPLPKLPNPLPIFIDEEELNFKVIKIYGREGVKSFHEIIKRILEQHKRDLTNYYLIFWSRQGGLTIHDLDFVSSFRYHLIDFEIINLFGVKDTFEGPISNIFEFEIQIVQRLFNNVLIQKTKDGGINFRYFDDIEYKSQYMTKTTHNNILKYRKSFYDFIYKSKIDAITYSVFYNLCMSSILDDINHDEIKNGYHTLDRNIKEKLNIFFSLNKNFGGEDMASKIPSLRDKLKKLLEEPEKHIETDEEFAFNAGQLIYYIVFQSETANKTHALLEPYVSKTDPNLFKVTITRGIEQYKHKLPFGTKRFQKLASEVLGYDSQTNIKELLPILLAGYFSNSVLFESKNN